MTRPPAVCVALLVVLAGCGGLASQPDRAGRTVNPALAGSPRTTPSPTPAAPTDLPPGVSVADVDERELVIAHHEALSDRAVTVRIHETLVAANGTTLLSRTMTTRTNGSRQSFATVTSGPMPTALGRLIDTDYWTNGSLTVYRQTTPDGTVHRSVFSGVPYAVADHSGTGRETLESYLHSRDLQYVGIEHRGNRTYHVLVAEAGRVEYDDRPDHRNYRLALRVTPAGVVESLTVRYDTVRDGIPVTYAVRFRVLAVGSTTVERPPWFEAALNASADG